MIQHYDGLCALINKTGICHQCTGLQEVAGEAHSDRCSVQIQVGPNRTVTPENLFDTRSQIVGEADLAHGKTRPMHDLFYQMLTAQEDRALEVNFRTEKRRMSAMKTRMIIPILLLTVVFGGHICQCAKNDARPFQNRRTSAGDASQAFKQFQSLVGKWKATTAKGATARLEYELVSNGTALHEVYTDEGDKTDSNMITMYYLDRDSLMATHYCVLNNQPRYRAVIDSANSKQVNSKWSMRPTCPTQMDPLCINSRSNSRIRIICRRPG